MPEIDVLYLIEHVARELDIACAVKSVAGRFDTNVEIASMVYDLDATIREHRPRLIALPFFYSRNDPGTRDLLERYRGVSYVNLAFEQLLSKTNQKLKRPRDDIAREHVLHLASGDLFREFLCSNGVPQENVINVGSLSCSLYRSGYRNYFDFRRETFANKYGLDASKAWVFFPENFAAAFFGKGAMANRIRQGCARDDVHAYRDFARASFDQIMPWCSEAAKLQQVELIIRPRPAIARQAFIDSYREVAGEVPRRGLHFIKDASIREWILASDVVVSSYSTSLIEAAVAEKPVYLLAPVPLPDCVQAEWYNLLPHVKTQSGFLDLLDKASQAGLSDSLSGWTQKHLLSCGDAIGNVAEVLASACHGRRSVPPVPPPPPYAQRVGDAVKRFGKTIEKSLWRPVRRKKSARSVFYENDRFSPEDVEERTKRWTMLLEDAHGVTTTLDAA